MQWRAAPRSVCLGGKGREVKETDSPDGSTACRILPSLPLSGGEGGGHGTGMSGAPPDELSL